MNQNPRVTRNLQGYFDAAADNYASNIEPVFMPLAAAFVEFAQLEPAFKIVDLGSGTGLVTQLVQTLTPDIYSVDFSMQMLRAAKKKEPLTLLCADLHNLPFRDGSFNFALASFAFNSTDPGISFREAWRIMSAGGKLAFQEWGASDNLSEIVSGITADYAVEDPPPSLAHLRDQMAQSVAWDDLESPDDIVDQVRSAGFEVINLVVSSPPVWLNSVEVFIRYKIAWPNRRAEIAAMAPETQQLFFSDLRENIEPYANDDGSLTWRPEIIRVNCRKLV